MPYLLWTQACLDRPVPPNLIICRQEAHSPQSDSWQAWRKSHSTVSPHAHHTHTHLTHSTAPPPGCRSCLAINLIMEELLKDVANQWSRGCLERTRLDYSATPSPPPLHFDVTHTIVWFGFFGLESRAALLVARLQQMT